MVIVGRSSHVSPAVSTKHISTTLYIMQRITPVPSAQGINTTQRTITQSPRHWIYTGTKPVNNFGPDSRWSLYRYWDVIIHEVYEEKHLHHLEDRNNLDMEEKGVRDYPGVSKRERA